MKITIINGQNHQGSSYHIGRMIADKLAQENEITEFFLPRDLAHFCTGCYRCIEEDRQCPFYQEKMVMMDSVKQAELLIFTTPTYCLRASAPMKSFMDLTFTYWMSHRPREWMFHKKAVVISTAAGGGARQAIKDIKTCLFYWGVPFIKTYGAALQAMNWETVSAKNKAKIEKKTTRLAQQLKSKPNANAGIKTKVIFHVMRRMHLAGWNASPIETTYWKEQGWFGKARPWKTKR